MVYLFFDAITLAANHDMRETIANITITRNIFILLPC